ncbi:diacylglycerol kinase [Neisseriaceae bacterium B1]
MENKQTKANELKGKTGFQRIINASNYSRDGLQAAWQNETAFRQLVMLHGILFVLVWLPDFGDNTRMILIAASFLSLIVELFNTGLEAVVDYISLDIHPLAKRAKDVGSAAQMLALILLAVLWLIALF